MSDCCSVNNGTAPPMMVCPMNGARSKRVNILTVKSLVRRLPLGLADTQYYFCDSPGCEVVYFPIDSKAPVFRRCDLLVRVGAKEIVEPIPVCYCFGFTRADVESEVAQTGSSAVAERIKTEVQAGNCACEVKNPSGKCCLGDVARIARDCLGGARSTGAMPRVGEAAKPGRFDGDE